MLAIFVDFFNFVGGLLNFVLSLSYYLGKLLVAVGAWTYELLKSAILNISSLCVILYEDFSYFSSDVWTYIEAIGMTINNGIKCVIDGTVVTSNKVGNFVTNVVKDGEFKLSTFMTAITDVSEFIFVKSKEFLILLGNGTWFLITLLPKFIMTLSIVCWKGCLDLWHHLQEAGKITSVKISKATKTAYNYFLDVPLHCAIGLLVLYITFRYRYKIFRFLCEIAQKVYSTLQTYNHEFRMYRIRRRNQRQQRVPQEEIDLLMSSTPPLFAPSNSGPTARKPLRRSPRSPKKDGKSNSPKNALLCVVCISRQKSVVILPCKHLCLCRPCSQQLPNFQNSCPLCRNAIAETIDTYL